VAVVGKTCSAGQIRAPFQVDAIGSQVNIDIQAFPGGEDSVALPNRVSIFGLISMLFFIRPLGP